MSVGRGEQEERREINGNHPGRHELMGVGLQLVIPRIAHLLAFYPPLTYLHYVMVLLLFYPSIHRAVKESDLRA